MEKIPTFIACFSIFASTLAPTVARAQEVDCTVLVNYEAVASTNKEFLRSFAADLKDYVNNYKWGSDNPGEKIQCTFNIFVQSVVGDNRYSAQVFIGSQRKIFGTGKSSVVLRLFDDSWEFTYVRDRPLNHNPYSFNDLTSFVDFYIFVVLGFDYDTYDPLSGTSFFQKASDVASLGRSNGQKGWQPTTGSFSRVQLIDELLNPVFEPVRRASYIYHFTGLDSMSIAPDKAYRNILLSIENIAGTKSRVDPRNVLIKTFFDTKYQEIAGIFENYPDPSVYLRFSTIDQPHMKAYEESRQKRK
jgi:hypothetical protein